MKPADIFGAVALSVLVHALLCAALGLCLAYGPQPDALPTLELSSVELMVEGNESFEKSPDRRIVESSVGGPQGGSLEEDRSVGGHAGRMTLPDAPHDNALSCADRKPIGESIEQSIDRKIEKSGQAIERAIEQSTNRLIEKSLSSSSAPSDQARVEVPPRLKRAIWLPAYPRGSRQRGEEGVVTLEVRVGVSGEVEEAEVVGSSGFAALDEAALKAVRKATFEPARTGERPIASTVRLPLRFRLR